MVSWTSTSGSLLRTSRGSYLTSSTIPPVHVINPPRDMGSGMVRRKGSGENRNGGDRNATLFRDSSAFGRHLHRPGPAAKVASNPNPKCATGNIRGSGADIMNLTCVTPCRSERHESVKLWIQTAYNKSKKTLLPQPSSSRFHLPIILFLCEFAQYRLHITWASSTFSPFLSRPSFHPCPDPGR